VFDKSHGHDPDQRIEPAASRSSNSFDGLLPPTVIRVSLRKVLLIGCFCFVADIISIGVVWYNLRGPFVASRLQYLVLAPLVFLICTAGLVRMVNLLQHRVIITLTATRMQFPSGSWVAWDNIESIEVFSGTKKQDSSTRKTKLDGASDTGTSHNVQAARSSPKMCGIRLASYAPYIRTLSAREKTYARWYRPASFIIFISIAISSLFTLSSNILGDISTGFDLLDTTSEASEAAEVGSAARSLKYTRKRYGFDLVWGQLLLDIPISDLAKLMVKYQDAQRPKPPHKRDTERNN
jgi:hypothetical protein